MMMGVEDQTIKGYAVNGFMENEISEDTNHLKGN